MAATTNPKTELGHLAVAKALNLPVSTKHCIEICDSLRYKDVSYAKQYLEEVVKLKRPVPFKKFVHNMGHKKGMSSGRYPKKAASEILKLLKSVEANAHFKGLNTGSLKISKLVANRAPNPRSGGRHNTGTKRTHVEVEVKERGVAGKKAAEAVVQKKKSSHSVRDVPSGTESVHTETAVKQEHTNATHTHDHTHEPGHDHGNGHKHNHASPEHKHEQADHEHKSAPAPTPIKPAVKAKAAVEEPSSAELLRRAQQKAAELNRLQKERKDTEQVSNLYEELQKKGSLRSPGVRK